MTDKKPVAGSFSVLCKDCGEDYSYSISSAKDAARRGYSAPERCPKCASLHSKEINTIAVSHFQVRGGDGGPVPVGITSGRLGKIYHPLRQHIPAAPNPTLDEEIAKSGVSNENLDNLFLALSQRQVVIVEGGTGSGKSTYIPCRLIEPGTAERARLWTPRGPIVVTQPRIQATTAIPHRVAELLGCGVGPWLDVGYRYHGENQSDLNRNRIVFMTDGILLNWLLSGTTLERLAAIMIDEAHERSLNIDIILALLERLLPRYPHLKLLIASATIDTRRFRAHFGDTAAEATTENAGALQTSVSTLPLVPVISCATKAAGYEVKYRPETNPLKVTLPDGKKFGYGDAVHQGRAHAEFVKRINQALVEKVLEVLREAPSDRNDILGFLATTNAVNEAVGEIKEQIEADPVFPHVDVLPLYRELSTEERDLATRSKHDPTRRRIIIGTNLAETSLTIEELDYVIDSGLIVQTNWEEESSQRKYPTVVHSQAGCKQRWGRAGRVRPGKVHTLYTEEEFRNFRPHTYAEIERSQLDNLLLKVKAAGFEPADLRWLAEPQTNAIAGAEDRLREAQALQENAITPLGLEISQFSLDPACARLVIAADRFSCSLEMATLACLLEKEVLLWDGDWDAVTRRAARRAHTALREGILDDLELLLKIYSSWAGEWVGCRKHHSPEDWARRWFVNHAVLEEARKNRADTLVSFSGHGKEGRERPIDFSLLDRVRAVIAITLPERIVQSLANGQLAMASGEAVQWAGRSLVRTPKAKPLVFLKGYRAKSGNWQILRASALPSLWMPPDREGFLRRALAITVSSRDEHGRLRGMSWNDWNEWMRILVEQRAPLGARFRVRKQESDGLMELLECVALPPPPAPDRRPRPPAGDLSEGGVGAGDPPRQSTDLVSASDEVDARAADIDVLPISQPDDDAWNEEEAAHKKRLEEFPRVLARIADSPDVPDIIEVYGYDHATVPPLALVQPSTEQSPFERFIQRFGADPGSSVELEIVENDRDPEDDKFNVLVTREPSSELEVLLEPEDVTFEGFGWALDLMQQGHHIDAYVTGIDQETERIHVSLLPSLARHLEEATKQEMPLLAIVEKVTRQGPEPACLEIRLLDQTDSNKGLIAVATISANHLPTAVEDYQKGDRVAVNVWANSRGVYLPAIPVGFIPEDFGGELHWEPEKHELRLRGRLSHEKRVAMESKVHSKALRRALNELFRNSNRLWGEVVDMLADIDFVRRHPPGTLVEAKIMSFRPASLIVAVERKTVRIPRNELSWNGSKSPTDAGKKGEKLTVKTYDRGEGQIGLSLKRLEPDPYERYRQMVGEDKWVDNAIVRFNNERGVHLTLPDDVHAFLPRGQMANDANVQLERGERLHVRVINAYDADRNVLVSMRPLPPLRPAVVPQFHDGHVEAAIHALLPEAEVASCAQLRLEKDHGSVSRAVLALPHLPTGVGSLARQLASQLGVERVDIINWSSDPDRFIRNFLELRGPYGSQDIVQNVTWERTADGRVGARIAVQPGTGGVAVGPLGMKARLLARLLDIARVTIDDPSRPRPA